MAGKKMKPGYTKVHPEVLEGCEGVAGRLGKTRRRMK
jgi:hypothetical protein